MYYIIFFADAIRKAGAVVVKLFNLHYLSFDKVKSWDPINWFNKSSHCLYILNESLGVRAHS